MSLEWCTEQCLLPGRVQATPERPVFTPTPDGTPRVRAARDGLRVRKRRTSSKRRERELLRDGAEERVEASAARPMKYTIQTTKYYTNTVLYKILGDPPCIISPWCGRLCASQVSSIANRRSLAESRHPAVQPSQSDGTAQPAPWLGRLFGRQAAIMVAKRRGAIPREKKSKQ